MIELEYWQLLFFPLFFALGWAAARIDIRHLVKESRALPRSYFQGLNFLLNEQPDRAIEAFVDDAIANNPAQVEAYRGGKEALFGFFVGQVMKASSGKANPKVVNDLLREKLKGG